MTGRVVWVVDGDTIHVRVGPRLGKVRYIGINTPEIPHETRWWREGGAQAHAANRQLVARQLAALELDVDHRDSYGRLLAYVWVSRGEGKAPQSGHRLVLPAAEHDQRETPVLEGVLQAARLVVALQRVAAEVGTVLTPTELLEAVRERGYGWLKSARGLAGLMAPLGFVARHAREDGRRGRFYLLDPAVLSDLATLYNPAALDGVGAVPVSETRAKR